MQRYCTSCNVLLDESLFYLTSKGRPSSRCKECTKVAVKANRAAKHAYYRAFDKARASAPHRVAARIAYQKTERGQQAVKKAHRNWEAAHPEKKKAAQIVNNALRYGKLDRWPCQVCGEEKVEAHHADYSNPLGVVWLCVKHHKEVHKMARELEEA